MSDTERVSRAVLDADILFSRVLHDLFGRLALSLELFDLLWSDELLAEARRKLIEEKALSAEAAERWVGYLPKSFPAGRVEIADAPPGLDFAGLTADPDDHHVCLLAVAGHAGYLITRDQGYSPDGLREHGVEVVAPDDLLCRVFDDQPGGPRRSRTPGWRVGRRSPRIRSARSIRAGRRCRLRGARSRRTR